MIEPIARKLNFPDEAITCLVECEGKMISNAADELGKAEISLFTPENFEFMTLLAQIAEKIGENCRIYQQVTIGYKQEFTPVLGDNVSVTCGAKVLGHITMHSGSLAAAGAVVVKDVPENAIVAGVPAKVIGFKDESNLDFQG